MAKQPPQVHAKAAATGKGVYTVPPGAATGAQAGKTGVGPSNHVPKLAK